MTDQRGEQRDEDPQEELPPNEGLRSDSAGTGTGVTGPAPAAGDPEKIAKSPAGDEDPPSGAGATAGGGYGVAAERPSSGQSGEGETTAGEDPQTQWLRSVERQS